MATLTEGNIYVIESIGDLGGDDFIVTHAGDPEDIVIGNYTEGTSYFKIPLPTQWALSGNTGTEITSGSAGNEFYATRSAMRGYRGTIQGIVTSVAAVNFIDEFIMADRHTSGATATFKQPYLIIKFATDSYIKFTDSTSTQQKYCKGTPIKDSLQWRKSKNLTFTVSFAWRSVW